MKREYVKWQSIHLRREMEMLVFGNRGERVLVFPTRMNRFYEYEDRGMVDALREPIEKGLLQLFCVDGIDEEALYSFAITPRERIDRHMEYERYLLEEVLPFSKSRNENPSLIAHGCSLGAYHAMNIALRHPRHFRRILAFSGRYDLTLAVPDFYDLFGGYYDLDIYYNLPSHFVPRIPEGPTLEQIRKIDIVMVIGEEDPFYLNNWELKQAFAEKNVRLAFHVWYGRAHRFRYWRQMARIYV